MPEEIIEDEKEFVESVVVRQKLYEAQKDITAKLKSVSLKIINYMQSNNLKAKQVKIAGKLNNVAKIQSSQVIWEEEKCRKFLEPKGLWDEVVEIRAIFNPELIARLVDRDEITEGEASEMATVKEKEAYIKVTQIKEDPEEIYDE